MPELVHYPCYVWLDAGLGKHTEPCPAACDGNPDSDVRAVHALDTAKVTCLKCLEMLGHEVEDLLG